MNLPWLHVHADFLRPLSWENHGVNHEVNADDCIPELRGSILLYSLLDIDPGWMLRVSKPKAF